MSYCPLVEVDLTALNQVINSLTSHHSEAVDVQAEGQSLVSDELLGQIPLVSVEAPADRVGAALRG